MADPRATLVDVAVRGFIQALSSFLSSSPLPQTTKRVPPDRPCKACDVHSDIGLAYVYLRGLAQRVDPNQEIPKGLGGTIDLARQHLDKALTNLPEAISGNVDIAKRVTDMAKELVDLESRLMYVKNGQEVKQLADKCSELLDKAYEIPQAVYAPDTLTPERELLDLLRSRARGEIDDESFKSRLKPLLGVTDDSRNNTGRVEQTA